MAKNREIVPITSPNQNNALPNETQPPTKTFKQWVTTAGTRQLVRSKTLFSDIKTLPFQHERIEIYDYLITRSDAITKDHNFNIQLFRDAAIEICDANETQHPAVKETAYNKVIDILNQGFALSCKTEHNIEELKNWNELTKIAINDLAQSDLNKGFNLAKYSFEQRVKILFDKLEVECNSIVDIKILPSQVSTYLRRFLEDKGFSPEKATKEITAVLQANNQIVELSLQSNDPEITLSGLAHAEELYNIATTFNQPEYRQQALQHMVKLHQTLGDNLKAQALEKEAQNVTSEDSKIIKKFGQTCNNEITIKKQIYESTLVPIYKAASIGKWTNVQWFQEYGISGYIPQKLDSENLEDYNIKMALIFEAIILAINQSENHDPTCAIIFAQQHPDIIKYVIEHHPEYFVNTAILHICAEKLDIKELTDKNEQAPLGYKSYQEKAIVPFIEKRLTSNNIIQKAKGLTTGPWDENTKGQLLKLLDEFKIGQNLGAISDSTTIARILLIKAVIEAIQEKNSSNFAPFRDICEKYPELIKQISEYHPGYLGSNQFIVTIAKEITDRENKVPIINHLDDIEQEYIKIDTPTTKSDDASDLIGANNPPSSLEEGGV